MWLTRHRALVEALPRISQSAVVVVENSRKCSVSIVLGFSAAYSQYSCSLIRTAVLLTATDAETRRLPAVNRISAPNRERPIVTAGHRTPQLPKLYSKVKDPTEGVEY